MEQSFKAWATKAKQNTKDITDETDEGHYHYVLHKNNYPYKRNRKLIFFGRGRDGVFGK